MKVFLLIIRPSSEYRPVVSFKSSCIYTVNSCRTNRSPYGTPWDIVEPPDTWSSLAGSDSFPAKVPSLVYVNVLPSFDLHKYLLAGPN